MRSFEDDEGLEEKKARDFMKQILDPMMHLHANNVVHRDLKLDNILLKKISKRKWCAKLGDFGQTRQLRYKEEKMKGFYGNQGTVTPEMLQLRKVRK